MNKKFTVILKDYVKDYCIKNDYYTCGDNNQYGHMLDMCKEPYSDYLLFQIAKDIYDHSMLDDKSIIETIMSDLYNECTRTYFKIVSEVSND